MKISHIDGVHAITRKKNPQTQRLRVFLSSTFLLATQLEADFSAAVYRNINNCDSNINSRYRHRFTVKTRSLHVATIFSC